MKKKKKPLTAVQIFTNTVYEEEMQQLLDDAVKEGLKRRDDKGYYHTTEKGREHSREYTDKMVSIYRKHYYPTSPVWD